MIISDEETSHTEVRNCCDYALIEKLHNLVYSGAVKKNGKLFTGNAAALDAMTTKDPHDGIIS